MASKTRECACRSFEFGTTETDEATQEPYFQGYNTGCRQTTTRIFAQGHDAKLVGFLVRAELAGEEIRATTGGVATIWGKAVAAALWISEPLALKAQAQRDAAKARIAKQAAREANKTARASKKAAAPAPEPTTRKAQIKVGRWTYAGTLDLVTGEAIYTRKLGGQVTVAPGEYTEV